MDAVQPGAGHEPLVRGLSTVILCLEHVNERTGERGRWIVYGYDLATVKITCYFDGCFVFALGAIRR